jgi:hypothetical protein
MDEREKIFLTHIAAGVDPLTAYAATPREAPSRQPKRSNSGKGSKWKTAVALIVVDCLLNPRDTMKQDQSFDLTLHLAGFVSMHQAGEYVINANCKARHSRPHPYYPEGIPN